MSTGRTSPPRAHMDPLKSCWANSHASQALLRFLHLLLPLSFFLLFSLELFCRSLSRSLHLLFAPPRLSSLSLYLCQFPGHFFSPPSLLFLLLSFQFCGSSVSCSSYCCLTSSRLLGQSDLLGHFRTFLFECFPSDLCQPLLSLCTCKILLKTPLLFHCLLLPFLFGGFGSLELSPYSIRYTRVTADAV